MTVTAVAGPPDRDATQWVEDGCPASTSCTVHLPAPTAPLWARRRRRTRDGDRSPANIEKTFDQIDLVVSHIMASGAFPVIMGGDHSIGYPDAKALARHIDGKLGIIHFDRHTDTADHGDGRRVDLLGDPDGALPLLLLGAVDVPRTVAESSTAATSCRATCRSTRSCTSSRRSTSCSTRVWCQAIGTARSSSEWLTRSRLSRLLGTTSKLNRDPAFIRDLIAHGVSRADEFVAALAFERAWRAGHAEAAAAFFADDAEITSG